MPIWTTMDDDRYRRETPAELAQSLVENELAENTRIFQELMYPFRNEGFPTFTDDNAVLIIANEYGTFLNNLTTINNRIFFREGVGEVLRESYPDEYQRFREQESAYNDLVLRTIQWEEGFLDEN